MVSAPWERTVRVAYFVPPSQHFAGIERVVHELATGLVETSDDLDVHVVFATHYPEDVLVDTRYTKHVLGVDRLRQLARSLRRCVAENRFDVLVVPQVEASVIAWLATRGIGLPVFVTHLHGNPRIEEAEGTRRTRMAFTFFRYVVSRRIAAVLAVSPSLRDYAAGAVARHTPVHFVPNPVRDLGVSTPRAAADGRFRFLSVGRLSRQKGQDILLRALAVARSQLPPVLLTMVGTGSEEAQLRRLSSELGLDDIVVFAGYTSDPAVHFRSSDCFVLASRWEGFGMVLLEALHFGLPLLATDCEFGPADLIDDPAIGELVAPDSPAALAEGMKRAATRRPDRDAEERRRAIPALYAPHEAAAAHTATLRAVVAAAAPLRAGAHLVAFARG
jgi:glycosyltransferase involved in cell wall biosynthesis